VCRGKDGGGRRCPGHNKPEAAAAHNQRRRDNRKIKAGIVAWAEAQGYGADGLDRLRKAGPREVKDWAEEHGLNPADFLKEPQVVGGPKVPGGIPAAAPGIVLGAGGGGGGVRAAGGGGGAGGPAGRGGGAAAPPPAPDPLKKPWEDEFWAEPGLVESIRAIQTAQGGDRDERALLDGQGVALARPDAGTNETVRIELNNGRIGFHKPFAGLDNDIAWGFGQDQYLQPVHEAAAWQLAKKMGPPWEDIVPPCVLREMHGKMGSFALERPGVIGNRDFESTQDWKHAAFFDALIGQQDRHRNNYLTRGDRLTLIDHGYAFSRPGDYLNFSNLQERRAGEPLTPEEHKVLDRLIADPELFGLRRFLEPARADAVLQRAQRMRESGQLMRAGETLSGIPRRSSSEGTYEYS
jgi:hypothetical protein